MTGIVAVAMFYMASKFATLEKEAEDFAARGPDESLR
jgi:hypothetical protein